MINNTYMDFVRKHSMHSQRSIERQSMYLMIEAAEFANEVKRTFTKDYGNLTIDRRNKMVEELGDTLFYIFLLMDSLGVSIDEVMLENMTKLEARYAKRSPSERCLGYSIESLYSPVPDVPKSN